MQCPRCHAENRESRRFCGECGLSFAGTCPSCGFLNEANEKFCGGCGKSLTAVPPTEPKLSAPRAYTPKHLAERILTSKAALEGERKQVTVLFADLKGSMELLADRDPEEARKILDPVLELMMEAVHRYEGTVNQVMGDGIMALFGAPLAHEDHAVRACYAALRMQERVKQYGEDRRRAEGVSIRIRVGLNSGDVVVRAIDSDLRMDYTAVGLTTHLAARMEQLAEPGTIALAPATLALAEGFIHVKTLGPTPIKGLSVAVEVYELIAATGARSRLQAVAPRGVAKFVGRSAEMTQLQEALGGTRAGTGQVVAVVGEPGVGKSRLFREFTRSHRTEGCLILEAPAVSYGKATDYLPVTHLVKSYFGIEPRDETPTVREKVTRRLRALDHALEASLPELLALLDEPTKDEHWDRLEPSQRRGRTLDGVKRLLFRESQIQPLVAVFEDLQWIDGETQAVLDSLVDSLSTARLLLLINYRPEYQHPWSGKSHYRELRIDPLPPVSVSELLDELLGRQADDAALRQLLAQRTEGNPFFIEETVRSLIDTGALVGEKGAYRLVRPVDRLLVPATAQAILAARIDRLDPADKRRLQAAAVVGRNVPLVLLEAISEERGEDLRAGIARLEAAEFLYETRLFPDVEYTFKHALTHEVAYGTLLTERRRSLHQAVLAAMESTGVCEDSPDTLAHHAIHARLMDRGADYMRAAGEKAYRRGSLGAATEKLEHALRIITELPPDDPATLRRAVDIRSELSAPALMSGDVARGVALRREAAAFARQLHDDIRLARALSLIAGDDFVDGRYVEGAKTAREALAIALRDDDGFARIYARQTLAQNCIALGSFTEAVALLSETIFGDDADQAKKRFPGALYSSYLISNLFLSRAHAEIGEFPAAERAIARARKFAVESESPVNLTAVYLFGAMVSGLRGDLPSASSQSEESRLVGEANGVFLWLPAVYAVHGWLQALLGRAEEGVLLLGRTLSMYEALGVYAHRGMFGAWYAEALALDGKFDLAHEAATKAGDVAAALGEPPAQAYVAKARGDVELLASASLGAESHYLLAMAIAIRLGMWPLVAHCHLGLGKLYARTDKPQEALEHLATASTMYREMGMTYWLEKLEKDTRTPA